MPTLPSELRTLRLLLRAWVGADAPTLRPMLIANHAHLRPWIPERVSTPVPLPQLVERLDGYAADCAACIAFRFAIRDRSGARVLGEVSLFPRAATSRVALARADRAEIGYWLAESSMRRGLATEAADALLRVASSLPGMTCAEIHCNADNLPSAAVARRLGFELATRDDKLQVWRKPFAGPNSGICVNAIQSSSRCGESGASPGGEP